MAGCAGGDNPPAPQSASDVPSAEDGSVVASADEDPVTIETDTVSFRTARPQGVEALMDFQVGGDSTGCGYEPVTTFEGVYYRDDQFIEQPGFIDGAEIGWPLIFCLPESGTWSITVTRPDGSAQDVGEHEFEYVHDFLPGDPLGTWSFEATSSAETMTFEVELHPATVRRIAALDEGAYTAEVGDAVRFTITGFQPRSTVIVGLYELHDPASQENPQQAGRYLGQWNVQVDELGAAIFEVVVPDLLAPGGYHLVPDPASAESKAIAPNLQSRLRADLIVN